MNKDNVTVVNTNIDVKNGQYKCSRCGATDIYLNEQTGLLKCNYCRYEFALEVAKDPHQDISKLQGQFVASGAQNIQEDANDMITIKCQGCGAEIVIDTSETTQARCHWCRSFLSINQQIPNGSVPDVVLPFSLKKQDAEAKIREFVDKRKFFAHPKFKQEFTPKNIMGVYFPYMLVDVNAHAKFVGKGERLVKQYTRGSGDNKETYYDADLYSVYRDFDIAIDDLSVEASSDKLNYEAENKTTNIINSIMPFDTENCVKWNANYLRGFSSEKRDTNIEQLRNLVTTQSNDISRISINETLKFYDRGVAWENEQLNIIGEHWKSAYLPVWLYSYQQVKGNNKLLHYVAVNARTKEVMGSVPIYTPKLVFFSILVELLGLIAMFFIDFDFNWIFLSAGFIFYFIIYSRYRNKKARHEYEKETKNQISNLKKMDDFIKHEKALKNPMIKGVNNKVIKGKSIKNILK